MLTVCPVCRDVSVNEEREDGARKFFNCENCGCFVASSTVLATALKMEERRLSSIQYAALSHRIREAFDQSNEPITINTESVNRMLDSLHLPSPSEQAKNIIRYFGDIVHATGEPARNPPRSFASKIGTFNRDAALRIVWQLHDMKKLIILNRAYLGTPNEPDGVDLSLEGWEMWEAERRGQISGSYGFMALKFGDPELDAFLVDVIKPTVRDLGYVLEDMRDAARAGIIDNVMRARIRDSAFVLVDLTHDNAGAYWEAGYAEGLGKPVLYLCKGTAFAEKGTHFDTNHCTTVMWNSEDPNEFRSNLTSTLRRSLNLFN